MKRSRTTTKLMSVFVALAFVLSVFSCKPDAKTDKPADEQKAKTEMQTVKKEQSGTATIDYPVSTPLEITKMLNEAGAAYIPGNSNPVENIEKYMDKKSKAINLGIYGADLSYASTYNQRQETDFYLQNMKRLAEELGIGDAYDEETITKVEANLENKEELHKTISGSFEKTYNSLNENGMGEISAMVIAGGWIEGIYLSSQLAVTAIDNTKLVDVIFGQKSTLDQLIDVLVQFESNADIKAIIDQLKEVQSVYSQAETELSKEQLDQIVKLIEKARNSLV